jgi:bacterioferritin-associated ferredoxin
LAKTIVCHCEDISLEELYSALEQGYSEIESIKRFTGIGTGKCQGKCCILQTLRELDGEEGHRAVRAGRENGPGTRLPGERAEEDGDGLYLPTIRQPVLPLKIDDIRKPDKNRR